MAWLHEQRSGKGFSHAYCKLTDGWKDNNDITIDINTIQISLVYR